MTDTATLSRHADRPASNAPERIYATVNGSMFSVPGTARYLVGGWDEQRRKENAVEYVRGDVVADLLAALKALCDADVSYHGNEIHIPRASHADALAAMRVAREAIAKAEGR
jgi:hypothetical protein